MRPFFFFCYTPLLYGESTTAGWGFSVDSRAGRLQEHSAFYDFDTLSLTLGIELRFLDRTDVCYCGMEEGFPLTILKTKAVNGLGGA